MLDVAGQSNPQYQMVNTDKMSDSDSQSSLKYFMFINLKFLKEL